MDVYAFEPKNRHADVDNGQGCARARKRSIAGGDPSSKYTSKEEEREAFLFRNTELQFGDRPINKQKRNGIKRGPVLTAIGRGCTKTRGYCE